VENTPIQPIALALARTFAATATDTRRVFHGRGHLHPGLEHVCIDWYPPVLLVTAYQPLADESALLAAITAADTGHQVGTVLLQERYKTGAPARVLAGEAVTGCIVTEGNLRFEVRPGQQQNAGLFLDMRPLHELLQRDAAGANVLNLFAYTCSLSVAAIAGGARQAVNVDMSRPSIIWGERNHALNGQDPRVIRSIPHNVFRSWSRITRFGPYDLILVDPPSRQRGSFDAERNYSTVLKRLPTLAAPRATVILTINSPYLGPDFLQNQVARYAPGFTFADTVPASPEFADRYPERALCVLRFRGP